MSSAGIRAGRAFVEIGTNLTALERGLKQAQAKIKAFGASVSGVGQSMLRAGTIAATPFAASTVVFASFEQKMARVKALTNATATDFDRLRKKAKDLGASTVFSATQAADAMSFFALAGYDTETILKAIGPTLDLAATGQIEIAQAADIATKVMAGMGISADDLGNTIDVMAKAMTTANTDLNMLGEAFKFVGPMAKTAGISLEEITAGIQILSNAGVQGEMAGTTLRGMILSLTSPSSEAARKLEELGVQVADSKGNFRGLIEIIADLETAMDGKGSADRLNDLGIIFPARQAAGAAELVSQTASKFRKAREELFDSKGTASRIAKTQLDTLAGDAVILKSALEGLAITVGEALAPVLREVTNYITNVVSNLIGFVSANKGLVISITSAIAWILAIGAGLISLGLAFKVAAASAGILATTLGLISAAATAILSPLGLVTAAAATALLGWNDAVPKMVGSMSTTIDGMVAALKAGRLEVAMQIAMTGLQSIVAEAMEGILGTFGIGIKGMMEKLGGLQKKWAIAKAEDAKVADQYGTNLGSAKARVELTMAKINTQQRHIREGTIDSEQYKREMARLDKALADIEGYGAESHQNATIEIELQLQRDLDEIDQNMKDWSDALNPEALRAKLAALRQELDKPPGSEESKIPNLRNWTSQSTRSAMVESEIKDGLSEARKFETTGTFSAEQAARFGGGRDNIPKQQLDALMDIKKNTKRSAEKRGGVITP